MTRRWVLITGCSTGIGRALVEVCRRNHWGVVATARRVESLVDLPPGPDLRLLALDVTRENSIREAVRACDDLPLAALINNAGYGQMGPLELLRPEELRQQFETNVIGLQAMTSAFLPLLRRTGDARIIQVGSVLGRLSIPMAGAYNASKHAVTALAETLRMELWPDPKVILVEPGAIQTAFRDTLKRAWGDLPHRAEGTPYAAAIDRYATHRENYANAHGLSAEACAERIFKALAARRPPRRVIIGWDSRLAQLAHRLIPRSLFERVLRRKYGIR